MEKDPAFFFYSKDWLQGTAKFLPEEKGVYIDLLSHQHQDGFLPNDTKRLARMVGMSESEFLPIWEVVKEKFTLNNDNQFVNDKLTKLTKDRTEIAHTNRIISALAVAVKRSKESTEIKTIAKQGFNVNDFKHLNSTELTEKVTEWFTNRITIAYIAIANANANENENKEKRIEGMGEREKEKPNQEKFEISEVQKKSAIEFLGITKQIHLTETEISTLWQTFILQNEKHKKIKDAYNHFLNWLKFVNFDKNKNKPKFPKNDGFDSGVGNGEIYRNMEM